MKNNWLMPDFIIANKGASSWDYSTIHSKTTNWNAISAQNINDSVDALKKIGMYKKSAFIVDETFYKELTNMFTTKYSNNTWRDRPMQLYGSPLYTAELIWIMSMAKFLLKDKFDEVHIICRTEIITIDKIFFKAMWDETNKDTASL